MNEVSQVAGTQLSYWYSYAHLLLHIVYVERTECRLLDLLHSQLFTALWLLCRINVQLFCCLWRPVTSEPNKFILFYDQKLFFNNKKCCTRIWQSESMKVANSIDYCKLKYNTDAHKNLFHACIFPLDCNNRREVTIHINSKSSFQWALVYSSSRYKKNKAANCKKYDWICANITHPCTNTNRICCMVFLCLLSFTEFRHIIKYCNQNCLCHYTQYWLFERKKSDSQKSVFDFFWHK